MNEKIIPQLLDAQRATSFGSAERLEFALQALAWAKLSQSEKLPVELRLGSAMLSDPAKVANALAQLGHLEGLVGQAFSAGGRVGLDLTGLWPVFDMALRLSQTGVLQNFDAADAITFLPPGDGTSLPAEVATFLVQIADMKPEDTAYVPWDMGGQLAARAAVSGGNVYLESRSHSALPALVSLLAAKPFEVHYSDPIRSPSAIANGKPRKFDVAVSFPPFGQRYDLDVAERDLFGRFPERTPSGVVLSIRQLLAHADRRVVVAVQNSLLFSAGAESFLRKDLVSRGQIRAVVAMPAGLFDFTHIPFSVLVLDPAGGREQICFINADDPRFREPISKARCRLINLAQLVAHVDSGDESEVSKRIDCAEVLANDAQLQVSRYLLADTAKQLQAKLASADTVPLGDVVTTIRPMPIAKDNAGFTVMEVGAADLPRLGYITAPGRMLRVDRQVADKNALQFLRPLDIVLIVKGSVGKVGIVPPSIPLSGPGAWVAGQSAIVLRTSSKAGIDPRALAVQLRSPLGQELLRGIVSGASIPLIQVRELLRLHVLVPDPVTAERALEALDQEAELQREIDQLLKKQADVAADLWILD